MCNVSDSNTPKSICFVDCNIVYDLNVNYNLWLSNNPIRVCCINSWNIFGVDEIEFNILRWCVEFKIGLDGSNVYQGTVLIRILANWSISAYNFIGINKLDDCFVDKSVLMFI